MSLGQVGRLLFVLYCIEAGVFLLLAPWSPVWEPVLAQVPLGDFYPLALRPVIRSAVSGFGLVHLVWGAHDLELWLARRSPAHRN